MKQLHIRHQTSVADPLRQERLRRALAIIMEHQEEHQGSSTLRPRVDPQSTTGRNDRQSDPIPSPLYTAAGMESVTHA